MLLVVYTSEQGIMVRKSKIFQLYPWLHLYDAQTFRTVKIVEYYHSSLFHALLTRARQSTKMYKKMVLQFTAKSFQKIANKICDVTIYKAGLDQNVHIVPARLCTIRYLNSAKYIPGDYTLEIERLETI